MNPRRQLGLLWGFVAVALVALSPLGADLADLLPECPLKALVGLPCPTCGSTRAALALSHLDLSTALALNPLATAGWLGFVGGGWLAGGAAAIDRPLRRLELPSSLAFRLTLPAVLLANWVYLVLAGV